MSEMQDEMDDVDGYFACQDDVVRFSMKLDGVEHDLTIPAVYAELEPPERRAVREKYVELQRGLCHHCGTPLSGPASDAVLEKPVTTRLYPPNFFKWPVHLHHSHVTGMTLGAVHNYCNAVLWEHHGE